MLTGSGRMLTGCARTLTGSGRMLTGSGRPDGRLRTDGRLPGREDRFHDHGEPFWSARSREP
jgi:hypothetical protein